MLYLGTKNGKLRGMGSLADKLYQLDCQVVPTADTGYASVASSQGSDLWHQRLGHVHEPRLKKCVESESVQGIDIKKMTELSFCEGCLAGKMCRKPFSRSGRNPVDAETTALCTVTSAVQCTHPRLEEQSILLRLLMTTLGAVLYTS